MPELPEVETVRTGLSRLIVGKKIKYATYNWHKSFPNSPADVKQFLLGAKITGVRRRGKALLIDLSSKHSLVIHLKMTGQLVFRSANEHFGAGHPNDSLVGELPDKTTRVTLTFEDNSHLFFNDQRKFGWMRLLPIHEVDDLEFFKKLGPEPFDTKFTAEQFVERLARKSKTSIKAALLDQTVLAGVGNIYADESLWAAKIHPATKVKDVSPAKIKTLFEEIKKVLKLAIQKGGSTDRNYVDAKGQRGSYLKFAKVFRREGQPCPRCGTTIIKTKVATRGTHLCPTCQRAY